MDIDIEEAPAVLDAAAAAVPGGPALFPGGNVAADFTLGYGDVAGAFARAGRIVEIEVEIGRHGAVPLEPRALLADPDLATGGLSIFGMTKVPVFNRDLLASLLGMDETLIHVHAVDAGGGFGARGEFYPEDFLVPWLARTLRRPVMWVEDRAEHLVAVNHSRQQVHRIAAAFDAGGRILGLRDDVVHDNGAYCRTHGIVVPELTLAMLPGPYRVPAYRGRIRVVLTSKTPCGTYRAPGRFEGSAAREQLLDVAAHKLKISRNEIRSRNLLHPRELPCQRPMSTLGTDVVLDAGDYPALLAAAQAEADRLGYRARGGSGPPGGPAARAGRGRVPGEERAGPAGDRGRGGQPDRGGARVLRWHVAGPGHRDGAGPDRRGRPGGGPGPGERGQRGHRAAAVRRRVMGVPVHRGGGQRSARGGGRGPRPGRRGRRADARGRPRRPGQRARPDQCPG